MTTRIRLRRMGATKRPFFRVVVTDQRNARDGRFIENIGKYHPLEDPSVIEIDEERAMHWLLTGAQPSDSVRNLLDKIGVWERFRTERPRVKQKEESDAKARNLRAERAKKAAATAEEAAQRAEPTPEAEPAAEPTPEAEPAADPQAEAQPETAPVEGSAGEESSES
jgi:small subunit ribosomal protein S16